jgi:hypothetical protein
MAFEKYIVKIPDNKQYPRMAIWYFNALIDLHLKIPGTVTLAVIEDEMLTYFNSQFDQENPEYTPWELSTQEKQDMLALINWIKEPSVVLEKKDRLSNVISLFIVGERCKMADTNAKFRTGVSLITDGSVIWSADV